MKPNNNNWNDGTYNKIVVWIYLLYCENGSIMRLVLVMFLGNG